MLAIALATSLDAQVVQTGTPPRDSTIEPGTAAWRRWLGRAAGVDLSGTATVSGEVYDSRGIPARRPGTTGRTSLAPQIGLAGGRVSLGVNVMLSNEGNAYTSYYNLNQYGLNPRWSWGQAHLGDFNEGISPYTMQGVRVRGGGFDLRPGRLRVSLYGGRTQRTVLSGAATTFRRELVAGRVGVGREGATYLDLIVLKARDDVSAQERALLFVDTTFIDTIPEPLRPRVDTRPQENLVVGTAGQLTLGAGGAGGPVGRRLGALLGERQRLVLRGELTGALITRDLTSPRADPEALDGPLGSLDALLPYRVSTGGDYAYRAEADWAAGRGGVRAGYEYVGAGYSSLGLAYLINDRRAYNVGGSLRLGRGRLALNGQLQHQQDNLLGQKRATTARDVAAATAALRITPAVTTTLTALTNVIANDAVVDTFVIDNRSVAVNTTTAVQHRLFGRATTASLGYGFQRTVDGNVITQVPDVGVQNVTAALQVNVASALSLGPSLSGALVETGGRTAERTAFAGFRGQGRLLSGRLRPSLNITQTFSSGRKVSGVMSQTTYTLPWETRATLQTRYTQYSALGPRPGFSENFVTLSVTRSF